MAPVDVKNWEETYKSSGEQMLNGIKGEHVADIRQFRRIKLLDAKIYHATERLKISIRGTKVLGVAIKSVESQAAARANTNNKAIMSKGNSVSKRRKFHKFKQAHPSPWP
ncbi:hypothetical protein CCACVL1_02136 [Corchorus capsularis]|uniref:Uncharacterized protein n=1 Tax=Corchorus capsularis TaxID=210143 RepID=A0A1R3KCE8_COCAP|nr:hypothetical protein CCACVL1_02136 [Corchorus capsularis]